MTVTMKYALFLISKYVSFISILDVIMRYFVSHSIYIILPLVELHDLLWYHTQQIPKANFLKLGKKCQVYAI